MGARRVYDWVGVLSCHSEEQLEEYLDQQKKWKKSKNQAEICTVCDLNADVHLMRYMFFVCADSTCSSTFTRTACKWVVKVLQCCLTNATTVYQDGTHLSAAASCKLPHELNCKMKRYVKEHARADGKPAYIMNCMVCDLNLTAGIDKKKLLPRIQSLVRSYRKRILLDNDFIDVMVAEASKLRYKDNLGESDGFVFGFDVDSGDRAVIGDGTVSDPLVIGFSTKTLLRRLESCADYILHIDATFKLNSKGFPVGVLGVSDMWRQFHPVAFFLLSDLKTPQWITAFRTTFELYAAISGKRVKINFVMMDADDAQRGALEEVSQELLPVDEQPTFLMCFFHVMPNVRKRVLRLPEEKKQLIYRHIYRIHYARTIEDKRERVTEALVTWKTDDDCASFATYFEEQWLDGRYSKWQCFETTTGMAKTNNPVENFIRQLKNQHSLRRLLRLNPLFAELLKVSRVWSVLKVEFALSPRAAPHIIKDFRKLKEAKKLSVSRISRGSVSFLTGSSEFRVHHSLDARVEACRNFKSAAGEVVQATLVIDDVVVEVSLSDLEAERNIDQHFEHEVQDTFGWNVDIQAEKCTCRTMFKLGCCVHVMAVQNYQGLPYDSSAPARRVFPDKRRKKKTGRPTDVGHALSLT